MLGSSFWYELIIFSREQMNREIKARREYAKKYSFMSKPETNRFYDQAYLSAKVDEAVPKSIQFTLNSLFY